MYMDGLHERLARLDPPVHHQLERRSDGLLIILIEPAHHSDLDPPPSFSPHSG
jgi:hypothetical protein